MHTIMEQTNVRTPGVPATPAWLAVSETRPAPVRSGGAMRLALVLAGGCLLGGLKASTQGFHLFQIAAVSALGYALWAGWLTGKSGRRWRDHALAFVLAAAASAAAGAVALVGLRTLDAAAPGLVSLRSYVLAGQTCAFAPLVFALGLLGGLSGLAKPNRLR